MSGSEHRLVLYPVDPAWAGESWLCIEQALHGIGFLGEAVGPGVFTAGADYLENVTYLGCSPQITLGEAANATRILLLGPYPEALFNHGSQYRPPRCASCKAGLSIDSDDITSARLPPDCPHCGKPLRLDWRRRAALARVFVEVTNVYESEAVPGEALLEKLSQASGVAWDYCYVRKADA